MPMALLEPMPGSSSCSSVDMLEGCFDEVPRHPSNMSWEEQDNESGMGSSDAMGMVATRVHACQLLHCSDDVSATLLNLLLLLRFVIHFCRDRNECKKQNMEIQKVCHSLSRVTLLTRQCLWHTSYSVAGHAKYRSMVPCVRGTGTGHIRSQMPQSDSIRHNTASPHCSLHTPK